LWLIVRDSAHSHHDYIGNNLYLQADFLQNIWYNAGQLLTGEKSSCRQRRKIQVEIAEKWLQNIKD